MSAREGCLEEITLNEFSRSLLSGACCFLDAGQPEGLRESEGHGDPPGSAGSHCTYWPVGSWVASGRWGSPREASDDEQGCEQSHGDWGCHRQRKPGGGGSWSRAGCGGKRWVPGQWQRERRHLVGGQEQKLECEQDEELYLPHDYRGCLRVSKLISIYFTHLVRNLGPGTLGVHG